MIFISPCSAYRAAHGRRQRLLVGVLLFSCLANGFAARESVLAEDADGTSWLYLPDQINPDTTYWVVVGVHGFRGNAKGAAGIAKWADRKDNVIVIAPQFGKGGEYTYAPDDTQKKLIDLFEKVQASYKVHPKMFLYGFSGGSQFAHRFAMYQPEYVVGVSAHSGGSWATGGSPYGDISSKAKDIPFAISCGEKDTGKSWGTAPHGRLEWFRIFADKLVSAGFVCRTQTWPGVGHSASGGVWKMTEECFALATTGRLPGSEDAVHREAREIQQLLDRGEFNEAIRLKQELSRSMLTLPPDSGWQDNPEAAAQRSKLLRANQVEIDTSRATIDRYRRFLAAKNALAAGQEPSSQVLLGFMDRCPPTFWKDKEGAEPLLSACNTAAEEFVERLKAEDKLGLAAQRKCLQLWSGLPVADDLMVSYNQAAQQHLENILPIPSPILRSRQLRTFIGQWQVGEAVARAKAELQKLD